MDVDHAPEEGIVPVDYLAEGIAAVKAGQKQEARRLLAAAIRLAPNDARAWGWFFPVCANDAERIRCLKEVLRINPDQPAVRKKYDELVASQSAAVLAPPLAPPQLEKQNWGGETAPPAPPSAPALPPQPLAVQPGAAFPPRPAPIIPFQPPAVQPTPTVPIQSPTAQPAPTYPPTPPRPQPAPTIPPIPPGPRPVPAPTPRPPAPKPAPARPSVARKPAKEKRRIAFAVTVLILLSTLGLTALVLAGSQLKAVPAAWNLLPRGNSPDVATHAPLPTWTEIPFPTGTPIPTEIPLPTSTPIPTETLPPPSVTPSPSATPNPNFVSPGLHLVGQDIQPGLYRGQAGADIFSSCYWERLKDLSNTQESILTNDNAIGQFYIQVGAKDAALKTDCSLEYLPSLPEPTFPFPEIILPGTYLVGIDIQPGQYQGQTRTDTPSTCYWERLNDLSRSPNSVINNGLPTGTFIVRVEPYDLAFMTECTLKRVGD